MNRRSFLYTTFWMSTIANTSSLDMHKQEFLLIDSVLKHMFDGTSLVPVYKNLRIIEFIKHTIYHSSYDIEIREFVLQGAKEFLGMYPQFISSSHLQKEIYLRRFEDIPMGQNWLYRVQILGFEAIYSSPVYGVNISCEYYHYIGAKWGEPLPKTRYIKI